MKDSEFFKSLAPLTAAEITEMFGGKNCEVYRGGLVRVFDAFAQREKTGWGNNYVLRLGIAGDEDMTPYSIEILERQFGKKFKDALTKGDRLILDKVTALKMYLYGKLTQSDFADAGKPTFGPYNDHSFTEANEVVYLNSSSNFPKPIYILNVDENTFQTLNY